MATIILIASGKGGVGKSTISSGLGRAFSESGKKILLVDCDAGLSSLEIMFLIREKMVYNWLDAYNGTCSSADTIVQISSTLDLMPAPPKPVRGVDSGCLKTVLSQISDNYDYIFIDAPAGLGEGLERGAVAAHSCMVIATADEISVKGAHALENTIGQCGITNTRLIINRYDIKAVKKRKLLTIDEIIEKTTVRLIGIVPEDKEIMYSTVTNKDTRKNKSYAAIKRIADRIDGKKVNLTIQSLK